MHSGFDFESITIVPGCVGVVLHPKQAGWAAEFGPGVSCHAPWPGFPRKSQNDSFAAFGPDPTTTIWGGSSRCRRGDRAEKRQTVTSRRPCTGKG
ncbi:ribonuclease H protein [Pyrus ussuriensis x Pyrus communis]|uniref:Ribonuclease H protein n=1 Tax=Pyrus ussuriensis x Pyrus communis TaxID=2448454 RepID=A0A5N5HRE7_9ROSA|nr:ribonuclease H protein [Pyrus ussuriensis x Pyrus communis]